MRRFALSGAFYTFCCESAKRDDRWLRHSWEFQRDWMWLDENAQLRLVFWQDVSGYCTINRDKVVQTLWRNLRTFPSKMSATFVLFERKPYNFEFETTVSSLNRTCINGSEPEILRNQKWNLKLQKFEYPISRSLWLSSFRSILEKSTISIRKLPVVLQKFKYSMSYVRVSSFWSILDTPIILILSFANF